MTNTPMEIVIRYLLNSIFSALAAKGLIDASQVQTGESYALAAISTVAALAVWAWGLYRSRKLAKVADVARIPGTTIITQPVIAQAVPATNVIDNIGFKTTANYTGAPSELR